MLDSLTDKIWTATGSWPIRHVFGVYDGRLLIFGVLLLLLSSLEVKKGVVWLRQNYTKEDNPNMYYYGLTAQFLVAGICLLVGIFGPSH